MNLGYCLTNTELIKVVFMDMTQFTSPEMHNSRLCLLENISKGITIEANLFLFIKDMQNIIENIKHCTVHRANNDNSITSIIYKK